MDIQIDVIATTISGSVKDWGKVKRIVPLFREAGMQTVRMHTVDSHAAARAVTCEVVRNGGRTLISAGGSGTFNSVLEGALDANGDPGQLRLGFLRKGSADLIGKSLNMPDDIEKAIDVFVDTIRCNRTVSCDILEARSDLSDTPVRRFVGYGGAEIFGRIPYFTENRFIKYYKGILSQLFGDLGPFRVGTALATLARSIAFPRQEWEITADGAKVGSGKFQAVIITNGDLGPDMPFARGRPLGSGRFHAFLLQDRGLHRLPGQIRRTWNGSIQAEPEKWGFIPVTVTDTLTLRAISPDSFPLNVDGATMHCRSSVDISRVGNIQLLARPG